MLNAFRIFFHTGWRRELIVVVMVLLTGAVEGIGIASLFPVVSVISGEDADDKSHSMGRILSDVLGRLGIPETLEILLGLIVLVALARFALTALGSIFIGRSVARLATDLRLQLIDAAVRARWGFFTTQPTARFTTAIGSDASRGTTAYRSAGNVVANLMRTLVYLVMALWVSWQFFLAGIAVSLVLWLGVSRFMKMARNAGRGKSKHFYLLNKGITDALSNIKALKAMNREGFIAKSFVTNIESLRKASEDETYSETAISAIQDPLMALFVLGGVYVAYTFFDMEVAQMLGSALLLSGISKSIGSVRGSMQRVMIDGPAFWSLVKLTRETAAEAEPIHGGIEPRFDAGVAFDHVGFSYGEIPVLNDVDLEIPSHAITTVIGASGAGKTTIADLLVGLNPATSGAVTVAGTPLEEIDTIAWRRRLGYIPQETILFNDTIANNVTLEDPSISRENVIAALKAADAWDFVSKLPGTIDFVIGVRGSLLSGGQRQRLSIARALCNDPQLLILDEATSALDRDTAVEIAGGIRRLIGGKTILAITHQPIWVDAADRVYEIRAGSVRETDPASVMRPRPA
jgi:ATP-binding cassette subfamily C protein